MINLTKIKSLFIASGLKESAYSEMIQLSQPHFSNCLSGKRNFSRRALLRIAEVHHLKLDELLEQKSETEILKEENRAAKKIIYLTESEIDNIEKIAMLLERQDILLNQEIYRAYQQLMDLIIRYNNPSNLV